MGGGQRDTRVEGRQDCDSRSSHSIDSKEHCCIKGQVSILSMTRAAFNSFCAGPLATPSTLPYVHWAAVVGRIDG
jgi:hypothetical protein